MNAIRKEFSYELIVLREETRQLKDIVMKKQDEITAIRMSLVTEMCAHCVEENTIEWDTRKQGYIAYCPNCGRQLMICSECRAYGFPCNYNPDEDICYRVVEEMWKKLVEIPLEIDKDEREYFGEEFSLCGHEFPAGIEKNEVWSWFNGHHPQGISYLINEYEEGSGE